jgi:hypothetical protein
VAIRATFPIRESKARIERARPLGRYDFASTMGCVVATAISLAISLAIGGCGGARTKPAPVLEAAQTSLEVKVPEVAPVPTAKAQVPKRTPLSPTASYEEALSVPEDLNPADGHAHLSDLQLTNPMREVLATCRVPKGAKVTMKVVVQSGHAIGVTVVVALDKPQAAAKKPSKRNPKTEAMSAKAEAKVKTRIAECADHAIRGLGFPPSGRRDSFTSEF